MKQPSHPLLRACLAIATFMATATLVATMGASRCRADEPMAWIDDLGIRPGIPLVMLPPAAGAIIGIDETRKLDSYTQIITLSGDSGTLGENSIVVTVTRDGLAPRIEQDAIALEMASRLPDLPLAIGPADTRNGFGVFGSATGSRGSLTCLYGWQGVNLADRWINGRIPNLFEDRHALSFRVRLCRIGVGANDLIAMMQGLQTGGYRYRATPPPPLTGGDALSAAATVDGTGTSMPQMTMAPAKPRLHAYGLPTASLPRARSSHMVARRVRPPRVVAINPTIAPLAGMPNVPLPQ